MNAEQMQMRIRELEARLEAQRTALDAVKEAAKELQDVIFYYDAGHQSYPFFVVRDELVRFYSILEKLEAIP